MQISIKNAIQKFFPNASFDMIYYEAVANALDAGATEIKISITIESFMKPKSLTILIEDNGCGFNDVNYNKFSNLLQQIDRQHKGLGRLVFLKFFNNVEIFSIYNNKKSTFIFDENFLGAEREEEDTNLPNKTVLTFKSFFGSLHSYENIRAKSIQSNIYNNFLPRLYEIQHQKKSLKIIIEVETSVGSIDHDFNNDYVCFSLDDLPKFEKENIPVEADLLGTKNYELIYLIQPVKEVMPDPILAYNIDGRLVENNVLKKALKSLPTKYQIIFIMQSSSFSEKIVDDSRAKLNLTPEDQKQLNDLFIENVARIISEKIKDIPQRNAITTAKMARKYPHLIGYFNNVTIGLIDENESVDLAQQRFFREQKKILGADTLNDEDYKRALNQASRVLTEYILYRTKIIEKTKSLSEKDNENQIHDLIVPRKQRLNKEDLAENYYTNNAWLIDDKYMTFNHCLSDKKIDELTALVSSNEEKIKNQRPDIAFIFSDSIEGSTPVDVVIIELKKYTNDYLDNVRVIDQLQQRARILLKYYPDKIQRIWLYGLVQFDEELEIKMYEGWTPLYSKGKIYYKEDTVAYEKGGKKYPTPMTLMSYDTIWQDAEARNATFLDILKKSIMRMNSK